MAITKDELKLLLSNEEPDYAGIFKQIDDSNIKHLKEIADSSDDMLASKAVYLASLYLSKEAEEIVEAASQSNRILLKIAAASALGNLEINTREKLAEKLIDENDIGIKKLVIKNLDKVSSLKIKEKLQLLSRGSESEYIRKLSSETLRKLNIKH